MVERHYVNGVLTPGYRVTGTIGDEDNASVLLPDAEALRWWWMGWWFRGYHERVRAWARRAARQPARGRRRRRTART